MGARDSDPGCARYFGRVPDDWGAWVYVVTDIESDGEVPGRNSMMAFASVAVSMNGQALGEFEAVLESLPDASPNDETMAWSRARADASVLRPGAVHKKLRLCSHKATDRRPDVRCLPFGVAGGHRAHAPSHRRRPRLCSPTRLSGR